MLMLLILYLIKYQIIIALVVRFNLKLFINILDILTTALDTIKNVYDYYGKKSG